ncbi:39955_t:CDS:1 [Gigaspora margarita]|uniref:39955_t:CDS:1 n=1 Tax=Gigaspora margarita TaxID=4874 RepID=A0ABN7WQI8_GIGMA|nr:39955_t:CDS:1 [Gigaspora margarita]
MIYSSIIYNRYDSALILEDGVDMELNITSIMTNNHSLLPLDWDLLNIGHCIAGKDFLINLYLIHQKPLNYIHLKNHIVHKVMPFQPAGALKLIKLHAKLYLLQLISKIEEGVLKSYSVNPASIISN